VESCAEVLRAVQAAGLMVYTSRQVLVASIVCAVSLAEMRAMDMTGGDVGRC
jgi:hypothetical protein